MDVYKTSEISELIKGNSYVGRGILIGKSADARHAVIAYFIMGRSENSRNRIFTEQDGVVTIFPFDESKVSDPSLIIYSPVRGIGDNVIVTNGDQTDTIYDYIANGKTFEEALGTRAFEPDAPNFTPRISGMLTFTQGDFAYKMSILKSIDADGTACARHTFSYPAKKGLGHFLHTYMCDGDPIPTFTGEPERVTIGDDIDEFTDKLWDALDPQNKISLYVRYISLDSREYQSHIINKNK